MLGGYAFLARVIDKVRAEHAGTNGEYIGYCPLSMALLDTTGVSKGDFDALITKGASDDEIVKYFDEHVPADRKTAANERILQGYAGNLDEQDAEEGAA
jgi:hypothetical protein